jgi:4-hydroxy-tetrahydrodipicolinate synthase
MLDNLRGVIAAVITPVSKKGAPDTDRLIERARFLLNNGCNALNLLGTTGEATSFSVSQRRAIMEAVAGSGLPMDRFMVGTGAAAGPDAVTLSSAAAELGYAGALVLPPFYYKPVTDEGIARYLDAIVTATAAAKLPIFLYNFPALSGIAYTPNLMADLVRRFGSRIAGLKDSSGDLDYAGRIAEIWPALKVFPSNEAILLRARAGDFAGCISATANLNSALCGAAFNRGDEAALTQAVSIRQIFDGLPLVPGIKSLLADLTGDLELANMMAPLCAPNSVQRQEILGRYRKIRDV